MAIVQAGQCPKSESMNRRQALVEGCHRAEFLPGAIDWRNDRQRWIARDEAGRSRLRKEAPSGQLRREPEKEPVSIAILRAGQWLALLAAQRFGRFRPAQSCG